MDDPYVNHWVGNLINRIVVGWLDGGIKKMLTDSAPPSIRHKSIWDDRILNRAFEVFGGVPTLELADAAGNMPAPIMQMLKQSTTRPS
jgi:hypothetical protein